MTNLSAGLGIGDNLGTLYGSPTSSTGVSSWESITGRDFNCWRYYFPGLPPSAINSDLQAAVTQGITVMMSFKPNTAGSVSDRNTISSFLNSCKTAGLKAAVTMYHEPFAEGLTVAQYQNVVSFYGPTVRSFYPYHFNGVIGQGTGGSAATFGSYYVSGAFDAAGGDYYCSAYAAGVRLGAYFAVTDPDNLPFGLWEWGVAENFQSSATGTAYYQYINSTFSARLASGPGVEYLTHFSSNSTTAPNTGAPPLAGGDYQIPLFQALYDAMNANPPPFTFAQGNVASASSQVLTVTTATRAGDLLAVGILNAGSVTVTSVTDSKGNTYTLFQQTTTSPYLAVYVASGATIALTTSDTVTVTLTGTASWSEVICTDAPGISGTDISVQASGTSTSAAATGTPVNPGETVLAVFGWTNAGGLGTVQSPFTQLAQQHGASGTGYLTTGYALSPAQNVSLTATDVITSAAWRVVLLSSPSLTKGGPLNLIVPGPNTGLAGKVVDQPLTLILPGPNTGLTGISGVSGKSGPLTLTVPAPHVIGLTATLVGKQPPVPQASSAAGTCPPGARMLRAIRPEDVTLAAPLPQLAGRGYVAPAPERAADVAHVWVAPEPPPEPVAPPGPPLIVQVRDGLAGVAAEFRDNAYETGKVLLGTPVPVPPPRMCLSVRRFSGGRLTCQRSRGHTGMHAAGGLHWR